MKDEELSLQILRSIDDFKTQKRLAQDIGVSVGKVNYVLRALIEKGFIKTENFFANKNKNQYKYLLTKKGLKEKLVLTEKFIERKKLEYEELQEELQNLRRETYEA